MFYNLNMADSNYTETRSPGVSRLMACLMCLIFSLPALAQDSVEVTVSDVDGLRTELAAAASRPEVRTIITVEVGIYPITSDLPNVITDVAIIGMGLLGEVTFTGGATGFITVIDGSLEVKNVILSGFSGSVITSRGVSTLRVSDCEFRENISSEIGNGLHSIDVSGGAAGQAGQASVDVSDCIFLNNHSSSNFGGGGAVFLLNNVGATFTNNVFIGNGTNQSGGALHAELYPEGFVIIDGGRMENNFSDDDGGAAYFFGGRVGTDSQR